MKLLIRPFAGILLATLIALTSVSMSLARGQMRDAAGSIVLCTGSGPVSVQVDANGEPIGAVHICPDCALGAFDAHFGSFGWREPRLIEITLGPSAEPSIWVVHEASGSKARGPPAI